MKISDVKTFVVDGVTRPWTIVKVETDEGVVGWGDCTEWDAWPGVVSMVHHLKERVIGKDPMNGLRIWHELANYNIRQHGGLAWKAMAGIDSALWDIRGKVLDAPVWQLLGGRVWDEIRVYWSHCGSFRFRASERLQTPGVRTTDDLRSLAEEVKVRGFTAIKTNLMALDDLPDPGATTSARLGNYATPEVIANAVGVVAAFREALGPDIGIALDIGHKFKLSGAIDIARALEPYELMWLEVETWDAGALRTIRQSTSTRICTGESLFGVEDYKPFLLEYAQDVIMPDLAWLGITIGKQVCDFAAGFDTFVAPHNTHGPICTLQSLHVASTTPNLMIMEIDGDDAPWRDEIMTHPFEIVGGHVKVPDRPGLGSDLKEDLLKKHAWR
ncbi:MAG: mandelate racemase/muconate lactonizing enzyme family protein [Candidatus Latescibacterota bacterium]|nr:mandelate racemase/muconate lactonizing enzyme family protein [Candidatus Latescibacterota bacterium]